MNLLIVEDDQILSLMLRQMSHRLDLNVLAVVTTGEEAVETALTTPCDLVFMDIRLEGKMDGIEACRQITQVKPIPVIFITGNTHLLRSSRARECRYYASLDKPVVFEELQNLVDSLR